MTDDTLRRMLKNAAEARRLPDGTRARILARLARRGGTSWIAAAAALAIAAVGLVWGTLDGRAVLPQSMTMLMDRHAEAPVYEKQSSLPKPEMCARVQSAIHQTVDLPGLRDAGLESVDAHLCEGPECAHVVYANSWLKLSCFVSEAGQLDVRGGRRLERPGVEAYLFTRDDLTAVAVPEGGIVKVWVASLRPEQLAAIAVDAERKRHVVETAVLEVPRHPCVARPMEELLLRTAGVEDVRMEEMSDQVQATYDPRRVSVDQLIAVLNLNGIEASAPGGGTGR